MKDDKKKLTIEQTAIDFSKLGDDNKNIIIGYLMGVQSERERFKNMNKPLQTA